MVVRLDRNGAIAGAALVLALLFAVLLAFAGRSGAAAQDGSVTVNVPPPVSDRIYASPMARGRPIVVIDAGHGGRVPGATSVSGEAHEKDLTLALARELRDQLVKRGRVRVAMSRDDDRYLDLEQRAAVARRLNAVIFVSLHMDSAPNALARGATIYSLSDVASDAEAARFASIENGGASAGEGNGSAAALLSELAMQGQMNASADLAVRLVRKSTGRFELRPDPHRFAAFHVLRRADTAAVLFEAGYISNADDELLLRSPERRTAMALALAQAIEADVASHARR
jgi:N-acetylmuramoyl-L-alanine amidase